MKELKILCIHPFNLNCYHQTHHVHVDMHHNYKSWSYIPMLVVQQSHDIYLHYAVTLGVSTMRCASYI